MTEELRKKEAAMLERLRHPNINRLIGEIPNGLVLEYAQYGSLANLFNERMILFQMLEVCIRFCFFPLRTL